MLREEKKKQLELDELTRAFKAKFKHKVGVIPFGGASIFLGSPGKLPVDKRDGVVALKRENLDSVISMSRLDPRNQQLYEMRDKIDHFALYNYFKDRDDIEQLTDPDKIVGTFRRKFYASRQADVSEQLEAAE